MFATVSVFGQASGRTAMNRLLIGFAAGLASALVIAGMIQPMREAMSLQAAQPPGQIKIPSLDRPPVAKSEAEKRILSVLDQMDREQRAGNMNVPVEDGRLLRILTESIGAKHVVELGTSYGYSAIWLCLALRTTGGKLTTHEIDARRAAQARANFKQAGVVDLVTLVEGDAHEEVKKLKEPIDLLFIDADKTGYLDYLTKLLPLVKPGGLIVSHNMHQPAPDPKFVEAITTNPDLETIFLNMHAAGIGVSLKKR
jgi:predicted O-methyltransferase YrrM